MQTMIVKLMYAPVNGWMSISLCHSRSFGIAGPKW